MAGDIYAVFRNAASFKEVSDGLLASSKGQLQKMKESLDDVMDYLINNTPLNWLVGPFYPQVTESESAQAPGTARRPGRQSTKHPKPAPVSNAQGSQPDDSSSWARRLQSRQAANEAKRSPLQSFPADLRAMKFLH